MQSLLVCSMLWESLPFLEAYPITSTTADTSEPFMVWEINWLKYTICLLGITVTTFTLVGCLCCRGNRSSKGFKEFKGGSSIENDPSIPQLHGLGLLVPVRISPNHTWQFEPLPVERFIPEICVSPRPKPPPPSPSLFEEESEIDRSTLQDSCSEWFQKTDLHVPREKLKYLREIGHGWFGKVVEGCAELKIINHSKPNAKNGNVVVRILTEEATAKEKAWFLVEATPYFKLRHRNILSLFGSCLETDPYLLLFESCPLGDLKNFLRSNQDPQLQKALIKKNMPTRIAIEVGAGLRHMHEHGLAHTDLSARNCLVASDLSIKLGDYGIGVEKYPEDYYVLGDRALPIRWSAPESVECTDTTIETREITSRANLWSYAVLIWEIALWGKRPYDELGDEKVIEMLLSSKSGLKQVGSQLLLQNSDNCASNLLEAIKSCLLLEPEKRLSLEQVRHVLLKDQLEAETSEFEQRWETLRPNISKEQTRSASLQDLRGSIDSEQWQSLTKTSFRLGPEEPVKNAPGGLLRGKLPFRDSDSETEEESWRGRVERGAYTEKVKQKSKSVADLMVLVHIEPDSDAEMSLGLQMPMSEKAMMAKKRIPATGSDGDLPSAVFDDQFDLALRKLRDPLVQSSNLRGLKTAVLPINGTEAQNLQDQEKMLVSKLVFDSKSEAAKEISQQKATEFANAELLLNAQYCKEKALRNVSKNNWNWSFLPCDDKFTETASTPNMLKEILGLITGMVVNEKGTKSPCFSNNFQVTDLSTEGRKERKQDNNQNTKDNLVDVNLWNNALDAVLEQRETDLSVFITPSPTHKVEELTEEIITPSPQSRAEYSAEDVEDELSNAEDLPSLRKRHVPMDDKDERKRMSTPDDERSSDSGFRDKESCEEEESQLPGPMPNLITSQTNTQRPTVAEQDFVEEILRVLLELDAILDAECYDNLNDSLGRNIDRTLLQEFHNWMSNIVQKDIDLDTEISETVQSSSETTGETEKEIIQIDKSSSDDANLSCSAVLNSQLIESDTSLIDHTLHTVIPSEDVNINFNQAASESNSWPCLSIIDNNEDDDSSTMSLRSDNSFASYSMDEESVAAIRNELQEKLPHAQMSVIEAQEPRDDDEPRSFTSDVDSKNWDDEVEEELSGRDGVVDISIRYSSFGTPLSPILEERESASNSESANLTKDESRDVSTASKGGSSLSEDDVLLIDTQTNQATLVEGIPSLSQESQVLSNCDIPDDENRNITVYQRQQNKSSYPLENRFDDMLTVGNGAPLPSPEEEGCTWQQQISNFPILPIQFEDNLMSTSFTSEQDWDSEDDENERCHGAAMQNENDDDNEDDEDEEENKDDDDEDDDDDDDDEDDDDDDEGENGLMDEDDEDDEENSSSSGEFVWQQYGATHLENHATEILKNNDVDEVEDVENNASEDFETEDEEEEEFTPSAWDASLAPHRSALRSPDKTLKTGDQKKSVWFKKQRYHCVYEYPKETPPIENQSPAISAWEPTSYTDWEEMINNIDRLNFQPMDYFETNNTREEEFYVSSSNRPFQFQSGNGKYVSQFFPGASESGSASTSQEGTCQNLENQQNDQTNLQQSQPFSDRQQLGELRHTRDRLKLNLVMASPNGGSASKIVQLCTPVKQGMDVDEGDESEEEKNDVEKMRINENTRDSETNSKMKNSVESCKNTNEDPFVESFILQQQPLSYVKTTPSEEQNSSLSLESKNNRVDLDVD